MTIFSPETNIIEAILFVCGAWDFSVKKTSWLNVFCFLDFLHLLHLSHSDGLGGWGFHMMKLSGFWSWEPCLVGDPILFPSPQLYESALTENQKLKTKLQEAQLELADIKSKLEKMTQVREKKKKKKVGPQGSCEEAE